MTKEQKIETMKQWLLNRIKKIFENTESAITAVIVVALLGGSAGILALSKNALYYFLQIVNIPTPLWVTTALVIVSCGYIYAKFLKYPTKLNQADQESKTRQVVKYFSIGNYKWKTIIYESDSFEVDEYPFCIKHDLRFIFGGDGKYCPGTEKERCNNKLSKYDEFKIYQSAKSIIENKVRNKDY